jgi:hypothetical protein
VRGEFVVPSPVECSDAEDDAVSPSQHKLTKAKKMDDQSVVQNSSSESEEEDW